MIEAQAHPFAFYGAEPHDWFEPEGELFSYELCFAAAPDAAARRAVAEAWERGIDARAVAHVAPLLWADRWALVRVRPAGWNRAGVAEMARAVQRALARVHEAHALEEVSLAEALESESAWDTWSLAQRPAPKVGPRWPLDLPTGGSGARFQATCAEDPEAEQVRAAARAARSEEDEALPHGGAVGDLDHDEGAGGSGDATEAGEGPRVVDGTLQLARRSGADAPKVPEVPSELRRLFGARAHVALAPDGRVYGVAKQRGKQPMPAWIEDGALCVAELGAVPSDSPTFGARGDGKAALLAFDYEGIWEVVFAERSSRRLFNYEDSAMDVAYGPEDRVLALSSSSLDVYRREGEGAALEQRWAIDAYGMVALRGGRVFFVKGYEEGTDGVTAFGFDGSTARRLARITASVSELFVVGDSVFLQHYGDDDEETYEILGWTALLEQLTQNPTAFREVPVYSDARSEDKDEDDDDDSSGSDEDSGEEETDEDEDEDSESDADESKDEDEDATSEDEGEQDEDDDDDDAGGDDEEEEEAPKRRAKTPEDYAVEPAPGRVGLRHLGRKRPFPSRRSSSVPKEIRDLFGGSRAVQQLEGADLYYGWKKERRRPLRFAVVQGGQLVPSPVTSSSTSNVMEMRWDGRRALVPADEDKKLWSVDLPEAKATLLCDLDKDEESGEDVYLLATLACDRILMVTYSEVWIFSLATGAPVVEARGAMDVHDVKPILEGRAVVVGSNEGKLLRVWGVFDDGLRVLAGFDLDSQGVELHEEQVFAQDSDGTGWYEIVNIEDAWRAARNDLSGTQFPRVVLVKAERAQDDEGDEDESEDEGEKDEEEKDEDSDGGGDDEDSDGGGDDEDEDEDEGDEDEGDEDEDE